MQKTREGVLRSQKGFTLIEIIAVLVILGILAAIAIPKYMDLQTTARVKANQGAVAAAAGNVTLVYASDLLAGNTTLATLQSNLSAYTALGDYTAAYATAASGIALTVGNTVDTASPATATKTVLVQ